MAVFHVEHNKIIFSQVQQALQILIFDNCGIRIKEAGLFLLDFFSAILCGIFCDPLRETENKKDEMEAFL